MGVEANAQKQSLNPVVLSLVRSENVVGLKSLMAVQPVTDLTDFVKQLRQLVSGVSVGFEDDVEVVDVDVD
jgi:hypothetical protein